jgi:hypothetical protein
MSGRMLVSDVGRMLGYQMSEGFEISDVGILDVAEDVGILDVQIWGSWNVGNSAVGWQI